MIFSALPTATLDAIFAWIVTFSLHSTLLILAAWVITKFLVPRHPALQEVTWKTAIIMGLLTTSIQLGFRFSPLSFDAPIIEYGKTHISEILPPASELIPFSLSVPATTEPAEPGRAQASLLISPAQTAPHPLAWLSIFAILWLVVTLLLLTRLGGSLFQLHRLLKDRQFLSDGPIFQQLTQLQKTTTYRSKIRLSVSSKIQVPIAFGLFKPEICIPQRAMTQLKPSQQTTLLAHEFAHLIHRDPHWLRLIHLIEAIFFFQPLLRIAHRNLDNLAEIRCDDWAVSRTGQPRDLARCLTEVAGWNLNLKHHLPVPGMANGGSILEKRVQRLLTPTHQIPMRQSRLLRTLIICGLGLMAMATPGILPSEPVTSIAQEPGPAPVAAVAVVAPTPSNPPTLTVEPLALHAQLTGPTPAEVPEIAAVFGSQPTPDEALATPTPNSNHSNLTGEPLALHAQLPGPTPSAVPESVQPSMTSAFPTVAPSLSPTTPTAAKVVAPAILPVTPSLAPTLVPVPSTPTTMTNGALTRHANTPQSNRNTRWDNGQQFTEVRELTIEAPSTLFIDSGRNGGISIKGWDRSDVRIVAEVKAHVNDAEEAEEIFSQIQVIAEDRIYAEGPGHNSWGVSYKIFAPKNINVDLKTHNGGIALSRLHGHLRFKALNGGLRLSELGGNVRGTTTNGGVSVKLSGNRWDGEFLDVETTNGGVSLKIPEDFNAELKTGTTNGRMDFRFPVTVQGQINKKLQIKLGIGGSSVRVITTNGGVVISR